MRRTWLVFVDATGCGCGDWYDREYLPGSTPRSRVASWLEEQLSHFLSESTRSVRGWAVCVYGDSPPVPVFSEYQAKQCGDYAIERVVS